MAGDKAEAEQKVNALSHELAILSQKKTELELSSPIDDIVVTFDLLQPADQLSRAAGNWRC